MISPSSTALDLALHFPKSTNTSITTLIITDMIIIIFAGIIALCPSYSSYQYCNGSLSAHNETFYPFWQWDLERLQKILSWTSDLRWWFKNFFCQKGKSRQHKPFNCIGIKVEEYFYFLSTLAILLRLLLSRYFEICNLSFILPWNLLKFTALSFPLGNYRNGRQGSWHS